MINETQKRSDLETGDMDLFGISIEPFSEEDRRMEAALEMITPACPKCSSRQGQWRGFRELTNTHLLTHRRWCSTCGHWTSHRTSMR